MMDLIQNDIKKYILLKHPFLTLKTQPFTEACNMYVNITCQASMTELFTYTTAAHISSSFEQKTFRHTSLRQVSIFGVIQSECGKMPTRITSNTDTFCSV